VGNVDAPLGVGFCSAVLLLASEVLRNMDLLSARGTGKKKGKLEALLAGVKKGKAAVKPGVGSIQNVTAAVVAALSSDDAFHAAHAVLMITAAAMVLGGTVMHGAMSALGSSRGRRNCMLLVGLACPLALFAFYQQALLSKASKALAAEDVPRMLHWPCRLAALVLAASPADSQGQGQGGGAGTPVAFVALQAASMLASFSAEIARGDNQGLAASVTRIFKEPAKWSAHLDAVAYEAFVPMLAVLIWLTVVHLSRDLRAMVVTSFLTVATSPVAISIGWPQVAAAMGIAAKKNPADALLQTTPIALSAVAVAVFLAGGSLSMLGCTLTAQFLLTRFGPENVAAVFS